MKLWLIGSLLYGLSISFTSTVYSQAQSYQVGYAVVSANLPEQSSIRQGLEENLAYKGLSSFEKDFVYYLNYVRIYPKLFAEKAVVPYLNAYPSFKSIYGESLLQQLNSATSLSILYPNQKTILLSRSHAADVVKHDMMSHNSSNGTPMQKRFEAAGIICGSECINMLSEGSALEVLLSLLVDYQVHGYGHRKSLLADRMTGVGVGMGTSKKGLQYTVIDLTCDK